MAYDNKVRIIAGAFKGRRLEVMDLQGLRPTTERVRETVTATEQANYADHVVYCIYNEMDNGAWFGDFGEYENRVKTYGAWKETYALVRSIAPDAKIGGPGYSSYNSEYIREFLEYCKSENCLPDTMIWHELGNNSLYMWEEHFADYADICIQVGVEQAPVLSFTLIVTEGRFVL